MISCKSFNILLILLCFFGITYSFKSTCNYISTKKLNISRNLKDNSCINRSLNTVTYAQLQTLTTIDKPIQQKLSNISEQIKVFSLIVVLSSLIGLSTGFSIKIIKDLIARIDIIRKINRTTKIVLPMIGAMIICISYYFYSGLTIGPNSLFNYNKINITQTNALNPYSFSLKREILRTLGVIITIGTGNPMAVAGPAAEVGMTIARLNLQILSNNFLSMSKYHWDTILLCGSSAGFGANFNSPISGIFFALEVTKNLIVKDNNSDNTKRNKLIRILSLVLSSTASGNMSSYAKHILSTLNYIIPYNKWINLVPLALLGVFTGFVAAVFDTLFRSNNAILRKYLSTIPFYIRPIFSGIITSISELLTGQSQALGEGLLYMKQFPLNNINPLSHFLMRLVALGVSVSSGILGGIVGPLICLGGSFGGLFYTTILSILTYINKIIHLFRNKSLSWDIIQSSGFSSISPSVYVFTGSVALLSSIFRYHLLTIILHYQIYLISVSLFIFLVISISISDILLWTFLFSAPFTAIALTMELSRDPRLIIPSSIITTIALYSTLYFSKKLNKLSTKYKIV